MEHNTIQHGELWWTYYFIFVCPKIWDSTLVTIMYIQNWWQLKIVNNTSKYALL